MRRRLISGKIPKAGNLLGTTRVSQPGLFGSSPLLRMVNISGGVWSSRPEQNGQRDRASGVSSSRRGSGASGRCARADEMITHRPLIGSFRSSGLNSAMVSSAVFPGNDHLLVRTHDVEDLPHATKTAHYSSRIR